ncbi:putative peptidoglycan binding domain-containing protein [Virgibacillus necropolis]
MENFEERKLEKGKIDKEVLDFMINKGDFHE